MFPLPLLSTFRTDTPAIFYNTNTQVWEVRAYTEVQAVLKDQRFSAVGSSLLHDENGSFGFDLDVKAAPLEVIQAFRQELAWVKQKAEEISLAFCEQQKNNSAVDFYLDIILPCCRQLACELTDATIKPEERELLLEWAQSVFFMNENKETANATDAMKNMSAYFLNKVVASENVPQPDFITVLTKSNVSKHELLSPVIQLFTGLATSLPLLLSNALLALLSHPAEREKYLKNPVQSSNELLRYAGPAQTVYRRAMHEITLGNEVIHRGDRLELYLSQANFDEKQFSCPYHLDSSRSAVAHLSLGKGWHSCLGAPLIREILMIIPATIIHFFPDAEINENEVVYGGSLTIQGVVCLPKKVVDTSTSKL